MPNDTLEKPQRQLLALYLSAGFGSVTVGRLLTTFGDAGSIFEASVKELLHIEGIGPKTARAIADIDSLDAADQEIATCHDAGIQLLFLGDAAYPKNLAEIYSPPPVLYVRGNMHALNGFCLGFVGSRRCTHYGQQHARQFAAQLAEIGVVIVSGLARGIDTFSHRGALEGRGRTVAVMGCALDYNYPPENKALKEKIVIGGGALLSEFPLGTRPDRANFPRRNRIISGLSRGVLVIQAGQKSGALLTANWANEQGRDVFVIPDRIDNPYSKGSHELIKHGMAKLVCTTEDILEEYPDFTEASNPPNPDKSSKELDLSPQSKKVFDAIGHEEVHIDSIVSTCKMPVTTVQGILLRLQMAGVLRQLPGMFYERC